MEKKQVLDLPNHLIYYVKTDAVNYYIAIPKNFTTTNICLEIKNKMDNYDLETNDEIWVMENVKTTYSYIDTYNITMVIPILSEENVSVLEKIDDTKYEDIDKIFGFIINNAYSILKEENIKVDPQVILVDNDRYKSFINWFTTRYQSRISCKSLLELIRIFNALEAISLLTGLKQEIVNASGVSSMIISTPKICSNDLIFLPSLPMILPFISSFGKEIVVIVLSVVTS